MGTQSEIVSKIKKAILTIDKDAKIYLFGSRARGDARTDSDWDFLILTSYQINESLKRKFRSNLFYTELETESAISSIIYSNDEWNHPRTQVTPFYQNVLEEGIRI